MRKGMLYGIAGVVFMTATAFYLSFKAPEKDISNIEIFFGNDDLDPEVSCNKVFPVLRSIPKTSGIGKAALKELLLGPTDFERAKGYFTSLNPGTEIKNLKIVDGTAYADFSDTLEKGVGGSCRVAAIRSEITQTLKQFSTIKNVVISIGGRSEDILQP